MKISRRYYAAWRILYTVYWKVDAVWGMYDERFPCLESWLCDRMDSIGIRMGFLIPELGEQP